jgi:hypothetical protein
MRREQARQQPHRSAAVAGIENVVRLNQALFAPAANHQIAIVTAIYLNPQSPQARDCRCTIRRLREVPHPSLSACYAV